MSASCIYTGSIRHRRHTPVLHQFSYRMCMLYLDLDELPALLEKTPFWSASHPAAGRFRREDFLGDSDRPLVDCLRDLVERETGTRPGAVRLLANLRYFGFLMNPIACYYCYAPGSDTLQAIVAEVTNTPWNDRHAYVLPVTGEDALDDIWFQKSFHVSPFNPLNMRYRWRSRRPGERLAIHLENHLNGTCVFDATLKLEREPISAAALNRLLFIRYPLMTVRIAAGIYYQAFKLFIRRAPFYARADRPDTLTAQQRTRLLAEETTG